MGTDALEALAPFVRIDQQCPDALCRASLLACE
jgi:hypothetical protein